MGMLSALRSMIAVVKSPVATQEGLLDASWPINYWQMNLRPGRSGGNSVVEACIDTIAQTVAQCPVIHWKKDGKGGLIPVENSVAARLMHRPNGYQTRSDLWLNAVHSLYKEGNAYIYIGERNSRGESTSMHLLNPLSTKAFFVQESNDVFYALSQSGWASGAFDASELDYVPSRDMIHIRLHTPHDPLRGVTPMVAAAASIAANNSITSSQAAFFTNMSRPSGIISTDEKLSKEQMAALRESWEAQSSNINSGKIPILSSGLKWYPLAITSQDAQLIEALKFTVEDISRVFRVPLPLINAMSGQTFNNAESMLNWWLASGLGFLLDHIELALNHAFGLPIGEALNFDSDVLLRSDLQTKITALGEAVMKSVYSPNEARNRLGMPSVEYGDEPRAQQQVVPLSYYQQKLDMDQEKIDIQRESAKRQDDAAAEQAKKDEEAAEEDSEKDNEEDEYEATKSATGDVVSFMRQMMEARVAG